MIKKFILLLVINLFLFTGIANAYQTLDFGININIDSAVVDGTFYDVCGDDVGESQDWTYTNSHNTFTIGVDSPDDKLGVFFKLNGFFDNVQNENFHPESFVVETNGIARTFNEKGNLVGWNEVIVGPFNLWPGNNFIEFRGKEWHDYFECRFVNPSGSVHFEGDGYITLAPHPAPPPPDPNVCSISGIVFEDNNQNGIFDTGDSGMPGRTVYLTNTDDTVVKKITITDSSGRYLIDRLAAASDRRIKHNVPSGFVRTTDDSIPIDFKDRCEQTWDFGVINTAQLNRNPTITSSPITTGREGILYTYDVNATDPDGDTLTFSLTSTIAGMSINSNTGVITWSPSSSQTGPNQVTVQVSDGNGGTATQSFTLTISANNPPVLNSIGNKAVNEGVLLQFPISGSDSDGDALTFSTGPLPLGATFNPTTKTFSWTPTFLQAGTFPNIIFSVTDGQVIVSETITITVNNVNRIPVITSIPTTTATEDTLYTYDVNAIDPDTDDILIFLVSGPSGMSISSSTGLVSWTPTDAQAVIGTHSVTVRVDDQKGGIVPQTFSITVSRVNDAPVISGVPDQSLQEDSGLNNDIIDLFTFASDEEDPDTSLTFSITSQSDTGVVSCSLDSNRFIDCTTQADQNGVSDVTVQVSDTGGLTDTDTFRVTVTAVNDAPTITSTAVTTATVGLTYTYNVDATDADGDTLTFSLTTFPSGMTINSATGVITWTPTNSDIGSNPVTVEVSDGNGGTDTQPFTITVSANGPPTVTITHPLAPNNNNFVVGFPVRIIASLSDPENDPLTFSVDFGDGSGVDSGPGATSVNLVNTYSTPGTFTITVSATDGGSTGIDTVPITIWPFGFNITNLLSFNNSDFTNQDTVFFRNEPLFVKFNVIQKDAGFPIPNNINRVYIFNRDSPSQIFDLTAFNGVANGVTIIGGQPSTPDGSYYFNLPNLPLNDDILGFNIVFVFSRDSTVAGQAELQIQVLNNPLQLLDFSNIVLNQLSGSTIFTDLDLNPFVLDLETPDSEITWTFSTPGPNVNVALLAGNIARFSAPSNFQGLETITIQADDNDGSTVSKPIIVSSGIPVVNVLTPNGGEGIFGTTPITWTATDPQSEPLTITLQYSDNNGATFNTIASGLSNTGLFNWNTLGLTQGNQYLVRVIATDPGGLTGQDTSNAVFTILSSSDIGLTVKILADKTQGRPPLKVRFDAQVTGGNAPFTFAWDFNNDGFTDSTSKNPTAIFQERNLHTVTLTATDFDGDTATATITIDTRRQPSQLSRKKIHISQIRFLEEVRAGQDWEVTINLENKDVLKTRELSVSVVIPELGLRKKVGNERLKRGEEDSKRILITIPKDTKPGIYDVLITVNDHDTNRRIWREVRVI